MFLNQEIKEGKETSSMRIFEFLGKRRKGCWKAKEAAFTSSYVEYFSQKRIKIKYYMYSHVI